MDNDCKDILPLPRCWHEPWHTHASANGLSGFPTRQFLQAHPQQSHRFCQWLRKQLKKNEGKMCGQADRKACCTCQRESVSKVISIGILSLLVRDADPALHTELRRKFRLMTNYTLPPRRSRPPPAPDGSPEPRPPVAEHMPVPANWSFTNVVAREARSEWYWLQEP